MSWFERISNKIVMSILDQLHSLLLIYSAKRDWKFQLWLTKYSFDRSPNFLLINQTKLETTLSCNHESGKMKVLAFIAKIRSRTIHRRGLLEIHKTVTVQLLYAYFNSLVFFVCLRSCWNYLCNFKYMHVRIYPRAFHVSFINYALDCCS